MFDNIAYGYYVRYNVFSVERSIFFIAVNIVL